MDTYSILFPIAIFYKIDIKTHLEKLLEREKLKRVPSLWVRACDELKKKGAKFDLLRRLMRLIGEQRA